MSWSRAAGVVTAGAVAVALALASCALAASPSVFVELSSPQSDDQGRYVEPSADKTDVPVYGAVASRAAIKVVTVNGIRAQLVSRRWRPFGAPADLPREGFWADLRRSRPKQLKILVTTAAGTSEVMLKQDTRATMARLTALRDAAPGDAWARLRLGAALAEQEKADRALVEYRKAVELAPGQAAARSALGHFLLSRGKSKAEEAAKTLAVAVQLDPAYGPTRAVYGSALVLAGQETKGLAELRKAAQLAPTDARLHYTAGVATLTAGTAAEAAAHFRRALALDPHFGEARVGLADALTYQEKPAEAAAECRKAIRDDPNEARAHFLLANALFQQGKAEEAMAEGRKAVELDPKAAYAHALLGTVYCTQGKLEQGIAECQLAIAADAESPVAYPTLAKALFVTGRYAAAGVALEQGAKRGAEVEEDIAKEIRKTAKDMRSWLMDPRLPMGLVFVPLIGLLTAAVAGGMKAGTPDLYLQTLAWRQVLRASFGLAVSALAWIGLQVAFARAQIGPGSYDVWFHFLYVILVFAGLAAAGLVLTLVGAPIRAWPVAVRNAPYHCTQCGRALNLWRMYYDGRKTTCAECYVPPPPGPPSL